MAESIVAQVPVLQITLSHEVSNGRCRILAFIRYFYYQYCMLNGKTGEPGGNCILRNIDRNIQRGGVQYTRC